MACRYITKKPVDADENGLFLYFMEREEAAGTERSIFLDEEDDVIVMKGMPHPEEYFVGDLPGNIPEIIGADKQDTIVYAALEGTSIHVFFHKGVWYTSTHKKLDAFKSYWADNTNRFGASFARGLMGLLKDDAFDVPQTGVEAEEDLRSFLDQVYNKYLDKDLKYTFLLPPIASERIGSNPKMGWPKPVNVAVRDSKFNIVENEQTFPGMFYPIVDVNKSIRVFLNKVASSNPDFWQGLYVRTSGSILQKKVYSKQYNARMVIRANTANLKFRYMFVRSDRCKWNLFVNTYPEFDWKALENDLAAVCKEVELLWFGEGSEIPVFDFKDVAGILERKMVECTFENLMNLSYTAPMKFNQLLNKRRKAYEKMQKMVKKEIEEETEDIIDKMNALDELE